MKLSHLLVSASFFCATVHAESLHRVQEIRYLMGTRATITVLHADKVKGRSIVQEAFSIAESVDLMLSNYKHDSEINSINRDNNKKSLLVSRRLHDFLSVAEKWCYATGGLFDITTAPLTTLWTSAAQRGKLPSSAEILAAKERGGCDRYTTLEAQKILFARSDVHFDTGGIGKGYAVDQVITHLKNAGIQDAFVSIGESSIAAIGHALTVQDSWNVQLQFPDSDPIGVLAIKDRALSASFSHGQIKPIEGQQFGHIIDSRTGRPLIRQVKVVVTAATATAAEVYSTWLTISLAAQQSIPRLPAAVDYYAAVDGQVFQSAGFTRQFSSYSQDSKAP